MAGIGFELKRIFKERSVMALLKGSFYSTFAVIGPMLILIFTYLALNVLLDYKNVAYAEKDLVTSILLYVFIFSFLATGPLSAVVSRYIADKIFEERYDDILPCYYTGLLINQLIALLICAPFCATVYFIGDVDPSILLASACMFFALVFVFYTLTYISALKEYKAIAYTFIVGALFAVGAAYLLFTFDHSYTMSVVTGSAIGFGLMAAVLFTLTKRFFPAGGNNYRGLMGYFKPYNLLFFTNFAYVFGLYIHNFVAWYASEFAIVVAGVFRSAPMYDTATFLAMLTSVSANVIFTVRVEINFHERYQIYCQELIGGIGADIKIAKNRMFSTLVKEVSYIVQVQLIITVTVFMFIMIFGSTFGFGGALLSMYPALAAGYLVIYLMYGMIIFLYYIDDGIGAFFSALVFLVVTAAVSVFAMRLDHAYYGIGPFFGAFCGFTVAFFRLRHVERFLNAKMFCKGTVVKKTVQRGGEK